MYLRTLPQQWLSWYSSAFPFSHLFSWMTVCRQLWGHWTLTNPGCSLGSSSCSWTRNAPRFCLSRRPIEGASETHTLWPQCFSDPTCKIEKWIIKIITFFLVYLIYSFNYIFGMYSMCMYSSFYIEMGCFFACLFSWKHFSTVTNLVSKINGVHIVIYCTWRNNDNIRQIRVLL